MKGVGESAAGQASPGGVTAARGFEASGVHCGIRARGLDLALIVSDRPASAAAVFTRNRVQAACVLVSREALLASGGKARAIVVNSGNANACTGGQGLQASRVTAEAVARLLGLPVDEVIVSSTGVIGVQLPVGRLVDALPAAIEGLSRKGNVAASRAILTTDTRVKEAVAVVETAAGTFTVGGMAKGSGMIHPDMATTLAFVTTDARIAPDLLQRCLRAATNVSFNRITVDGDTSTNDMIGVLANGASGVRVDADDPSTLATFNAALTDVLTRLAIEVARDGEGATKLITVDVTGALDEEEALKVSRTIAGSPLVRTAVHGADANWGRIVAAAGRAGVELDPAALEVFLGDVRVLAPGYVSDYSEDQAKKVLLQDEVTIEVRLGRGTARARTWTCDLTKGYIHINASYRS